MSGWSMTTAEDELLPNPHPGEILLEAVLKPMGLSQERAGALARALHPDIGVVDQPGRALLRPAHRARPETRCVPLGRRARQAIEAYIDVTNADPKPFRWTKTADDILASIQRFCLRALEPTT